MKTIDDILKKLKNDHRKVELCDVVDCVINTLLLLDQKSGNFKEVAAKLPKGYNGIMNTLTFSLTVNLAIMGLDEDEAMEYVKDLDDKGVKSVKAFIKKGVHEA